MIACASLGKLGVPLYDSAYPVRSARRTKSSLVLYDTSGMCASSRSRPTTYSANCSLAYATDWALVRVLQCSAHCTSIAPTGVLPLPSGMTVSADHVRMTAISDYLRFHALMKQDGGFPK